MVNRFQRRKLTVLKKMFKKEFLFLNRTRFLKQKLPMFLLKINKNIFPKSSTKNLGYFKKNAFLKSIFHLNFLVSQLQNKNFSKQNYLLISRNKYKLKVKNLAKINIFQGNLFMKSYLKAKSSKITRKKQFRFLFHKIKL